MWSVWLVFCDCGFHSVALWWRRIRSLLKLPDGRDWLRGKLGFVLMGRAMLSKSLIQFSVDGWGYVPSLLFDLRPNCGGGNEDNGTSFRGPMGALLHWVTLTLQQAIDDPRLCQRLLDTHGQVWVSLFWGHCSFLLHPGAHKVLFVPFNNLFPQFCVSSGWCRVGLMATSSKRVYAIPRSVAPRAPAPVAHHCWPIPLPETLRHSSGSVSVGSLGPGVHKVCLSVSGGFWFWF